MRSLFLILLWLPLCATAQKYLALQYRTADGLPSDQVRDVAVGQHGFLWVATDGGLLRYDGEQFVSYNRALDSYYIKAFANDGQGRVVLVSDSGLYRIEAAAERLDTAQVELLVPAQALLTDTSLHYPNGVFVDEKGRVWISQPDGRVARLEDGVLRFFTLSAGGRGRSVQTRYSFAVMGSGQLVAVSRAGQLYLYDPNGDSFQELALPRKMDAIHCLYAQGDTLLLGGEGLLSLRLPEGEVKSWSYDALGGKTVTALHPAQAAGEWLLGTANNGLLLAAQQPGRWSLRTVYGANDPHRINRLPFRRIHRILRDSADNIWLCTAQGLGLLQSRFFETVFGLANNNTLALKPLEDGRVLISYGDVYAIQERGADFYAQTLPNMDRGFITGLAEADGQLWMATTTGRLLTYDGQRLRPQYDLQDRGGGIFFLERSGDGSLWICQAPDENPITGIARRLPSGKLRYYEENDGLESRILVARESPRGRLYAAGIGPETYLYRYQPEEDAFINLSLKLPFNYSEGFEVHDLAVDRRGIVWLATTDGLLRYDLERIRRVELGAYTETEVRAVAALGEGELWLSTSTAGLLHYQEADQQCTVFNQDSGLPSNVGAYRCLQVGADGRIWVGTAEGTVYSRDTLPRPLSTTAPILLHAYVNGKRQRVQPQLELPHRSKLKLDWAVPVYPSRGVTYRYRLRPGADSSWINLNTANQMTLPPLTAGHYEWSLQARRPGGYTWSTPLTLSVEVLAPWYKRWWAIVLWVVAGIGLIYLFERYVIGRLLRRIRVLEERLKMRDRRLEEQEHLLEEQSAGLAQQESNLLAMSQLQPAHQPHALPVALLHYVSTRLDNRGDWRQIVGLLHQGIEHHSTCDALDICWYESDELQCLRLRTDEQRPRLFAEAFDEKSSLPVWVLAQQSTLCLNDCAEEYGQVVSADTPPPFGAMLLVRSEVPGKQPFVLSFMAKRRQAFSPADQQVAELLAARLSAATRQPLTQNRWL